MVSIVVVVLTVDGVVDGVEAEEVGEDLPTPVVVEVLLHLSEVATVVVEGFMTVAGLEDALGEGTCFARSSNVPVNVVI